MPIQTLRLLYFKIRRSNLHVSKPRSPTSSWTFSMTQIRWRTSSSNPLNSTHTSKPIGFRSTRTLSLNTLIRIKFLKYSWGPQRQETILKEIHHTINWSLMNRPMEIMIFIVLKMLCPSVRRIINQCQRRWRPTWLVFKVGWTQSQTYRLNADPPIWKAKHQPILWT